jgi:hypothetical protein
VVLLGKGDVLLSGRPDDIIAAMPGMVATVDKPMDPTLAWRVGPICHEWVATGSEFEVTPL